MSLLIKCTLRTRRPPIPPLCRELFLRVGLLKNFFKARLSQVALTQLCTRRSKNDAKRLVTCAARSTRVLEVHGMFTLKSQNLATLFLHNSVQLIRTTNTHTNTHLSLISDFGYVSPIRSLPRTPTLSQDCNNF